MENVVALGPVIGRRETQAPDYGNWEDGERRADEMHGSGLRNSQRRILLNLLTATLIPFPMYFSVFFCNVVWWSLTVVGSARTWLSEHLHAFLATGLPSQPLFLPSICHVYYHSHQVSSNPSPATGCFHTCRYKRPAPTYSSHPPSHLDQPAAFPRSPWPVLPSPFAFPHGQD